MFKIIKGLSPAYIQKIFPVTLGNSDCSDWLVWSSASFLIGRINNVWLSASFLIGWINKRWYSVENRSVPRQSLETNSGPLKTLDTPKHYINRQKYDISFIKPLTNQKAVYWTLIRLSYCLLAAPARYTTDKELTTPTWQNKTELDGFIERAFLKRISAKLNFSCL